MLVAVDKQGNRIYADSSGVRYTECYCPVCGESVVHKLGKQRRAHFAHRANTNCYFGRDKDYKSEWHIRMQDYFPKEAQEFIFVDEETGEKHIADVFLKESNTVLEFQHSPIDEKEFFDRTIFHLKNKRRIVWLFDESVANQKSQNFGRFKKDDCGWEQQPYDNKCYKWLRKPRAFLGRIKDFEKSFNVFSVCVYTGTEGDVFHRIIKELFGFEYVTFSLHNIEMKENVDIEEFFKPESYWQEQGPWKEIFEQKRIQRELNALLRSQRNPIRRDPLSIPRRRRFRL